MCDGLPKVIDELRSCEDVAAIVDAAVGWGRFIAVGEAQRFAAIAEWAARWLADADENAGLCAVDAEDDVVAEIGMAFGVSRHWAHNDLQIGAAMRDRFPGLAALFLRGEISAKVMATVVERTLLVVDDDALAKIDAACVEAALTCGWSGLSYYTLKNAVDVWIAHYDPVAVRRARHHARSRGITVSHTDDEGDITVLLARLTKPQAALVMARLRKMAKTVCKDDPRTLEQRLGDALEAVCADADRLQCLCGSPACSATVDNRVASRFVINIYGEAAMLDDQADPLIHGEGALPDEPADNVTLNYRNTKNAKTAEAQAAKPAPAEPAEEVQTTEPVGESNVAGPAGGAEGAEGSAPAEAAKPAAAEPAEAEAASDPWSPRPRHTPAPTEAGPAESNGDAEEGSATAEPDAGARTADENGSAATASTARRSPLLTARVNPAVGVLPGFGIVSNAIIAALIAAGAKVRYLKDPGTLDTDDGYRIPTAHRDFVQARDLCCRAPGCDRPIIEVDLDHTIAWDDGGPTHVSNIKGYCRFHHLMKTFRDSWTDIQLPDGTVKITTPTGHTYTSIPTSRLLFPTANTTSAPVQRGSPRKKPAADKTAKMPKRKRTKAQDRAYRIQAERAQNAAYLALNGEQPDS
jgi:hypothetical protein